jgi:hypothetical protein
MHYLKSGAVAIAMSFALVLLVLGLVALIRCPAEDIPAVIQAFGSWLKISVHV